MSDGPTDCARMLARERKGRRPKKEPTLEERVAWLEAKVRRLEAEAVTYTGARRRSA